MFVLTSTLVGWPRNTVAEDDGRKGEKRRQKSVLVEPTENYRLK